MGTLGRAGYTVGFWIRETGQAMDRLGSRLQGNNFFKEQRYLTQPFFFIRAWDRLCKAKALRETLAKFPTSYLVGLMDVNPKNSLSLFGG